MAKEQDIDFSVNLMRALLWQYNDADRLQSVLQQKQDWYQENQAQFWEDWYRDVFNLITANEFGLTVWSIILDVPIVVEVQPPDDGEIPWGYGEFSENYNNGNFAGSSSPIQTLTVEQARTVLRMRYFQITSRGSVTEINQFLEILFGINGGAYVKDNLDMTAEFVFLFPIPSKLQFIFQNYDILPRPAGVAITYSYQIPDTSGAFIGTGIGMNILEG